MLYSLQSWFDVNQRALPWRKAKPNPYEIWISEVMSQQSVLDTVKRYFVNWMNVFPTLKDLASASEATVMQQWAGLGYYSRARLVLKTAKLLDAQLPSRGWPTTPEAWAELPGVGPYTSKAISAIAFAKPVIPMDGNLIRVLARVYGIADPLNQPRDLQQIKDQVAKLEVALSSDARLHSASIAQGFMDLGATICRPRGAALCEVCPIREHGCVAQQNQVVESIPATKNRPASTYLDYVAKPVINSNGQIWVEPIAPDSPGNLVGQWQVPLETIGEGSDFWTMKSQVRHAITTYRYRVRVIEGHSSVVSSSDGRWVDPAQPDVHLTTLTRKILATLA
jgi:A/G-specific adenine glycosylase